MALNPFDNIGDAITSAIETAIEAVFARLEGAFDSLSGGISTAFGTVTSFIEGTFRHLVNRIQSGFASIETFATAFVSNLQISLGQVSSLLDSLRVSMSDFVMGGFAKVTTGFANAGRLIGNAFTTGLEKATAGIQAYIQFYGELFQTALLKVGGWMISLGGVISNAIGVLAAQIQAGFEFITTVLGPMIVDAITDLARLIWDEFITIEIPDDTLSRMKSGLSGFGETIGA